MRIQYVVMGAAVLGLVLVSLFPHVAVPPLPREKPGSGGQQTGPGARVRLLGWVVEYDRGSESDFLKHRDRFTWVSPTWLVSYGDGSVVEKVWYPLLLEKAREAGVKVHVLVANRGLRRDVVHTMLSEPEYTERFIRELLRIVEERGYDGVNLDLEGVPPGDRDAYTRLVCELAERLHAAGRELSIDVPAKTSDEGSDWSAAYDYAALAKCADQVVIMAYDYHWSGSEPGPISPLPWFREVLGYAVSRIPREKLVMGIPAYGYDWPEGGRGRGVTYREAVEAAERHGAKVVYDEAVGEATYSYVDGDGVRHVVWFSTARSMVERIKAAAASGVYSVAFWRVGSEDPGFWDALGG